MIHTPNMIPVRGLQLYSTAGAKPTFQLLGNVCLTNGPPSLPSTFVLSQKSASTSSARTHSLVRLYSTAPISAVLEPGFACPWKSGPVPKTLRPDISERIGNDLRKL